MVNKRLLIGALAALVAATLSAQPSIYFKWQNKSTQAVVCEPDSPGKDWVRIAGPFEDPDCKFAVPK